MASIPGQTPPNLSLRNGCRCVPEPGVTIEELLVVVGEQVGFDNIVSASRMNKAVVVFLKTESLINQLTVSGIWVKEMFVPVTPLSAPATKITISNVPPFISNDVITKELQRFGKIASPVRMIPLGCKNIALKHVTSFRRQVFMFLTSPERTLEVSFRVNQGDNSYMIYASTENLKCFECGDLGHKRFLCPHKDNQRPSTSRGDVNDANHSHQDIEKQRTEMQEKAASEEVSDISLNAGSTEQPVCVSEIVTDVIDVTDMSEVQRGDEGLCELKETKAGDFEGNMTDELDEISQCTDVGLRNEEQWSDTSDVAREVEKDMYTLEQINSFLDETKGKAGVEVGDFFPDLEKFVASVVWARKTSSFEELSQQKRFRLKKHMTVIRQGKQAGKERMTRGKVKEKLNNHDDC